MLSSVGDQRVSSYREHQVPIEPTAQVRRRADVLECIHADDVDDWTHHACWILWAIENVRLV